MLNKCEQQYIFANENFNKSELIDDPNFKNLSNHNKSFVNNNHSTDMPNKCKNSVDDTSNVEHLCLKIYEQINSSTRTCDDFAIITISALENLNVYKSALWVLDVILKNVHI